MIVVDASAVIEILLRTEAASLIEHHIFSPGETLHAPHLLDLEVAQVLRRYCAAGEMNTERGQEAVADLADFPITAIPTIYFCPGYGHCDTI